MTPSSELETSCLKRRATRSDPFDSRSPSHLLTFGLSITAHEFRPRARPPFVLRLRSINLPINQQLIESESKLDCVFFFFFLLHSPFLTFNSTYLVVQTWVHPVHVLRHSPVVERGKNKGLKYGRAHVISRKMYVPVNTSVAVMKQSRQLVWSWKPDQICAN